MADKDWRERVKDEFDTNPLFTATVVGAAGAILGLSWAALNSTPEKRAKLKESQAQYRRDRAKREHESRQSALRYQLRESYFKEGPGKSEYEARAYLIFPAENPFPDGTFEGTGGSMGTAGFDAASASAGARLSASYSPYDGSGGFRLERPDGSSRCGYAGSAGRILSIGAGEDLDSWIADARLMARLIAAPGSSCHSVQMTRPDHAAIREAIWQEYLADNPHIAAAIGQA